MTVTRRRADVRRTVFPRYVFIGLRDAQGTHGLAGTPGLFGLVRCDGAPVRIDPAVIRGLRADEAAGVFDFTAARERARAAAEAAEAERKRVAEIQPGRRVRMVGGTWAQFGGTVLAHMSGARVMVEVTLFARPMPVPIPPCLRATCVLAWDLFGACVADLQPRPGRQHWWTRAPAPPACGAFACLGACLPVHPCSGPAAVRVRRKPGVRRIPPPIAAAAPPAPPARSTGRRGGKGCAPTSSRWSRSAAPAWPRAA